MLESRLERRQKCKQKCKQHLNRARSKIPGWAIFRKWKTCLQSRLGRGRRAKGLNGQKRTMENKEGGLPVSFCIGSLISNCTCTCSAYTVSVLCAQSCQPDAPFMYLASVDSLTCTSSYTLAVPYHALYSLDSRVRVRPDVYVAKVAGFSPYTHICRLTARPRPMSRCGHRE